LKSRIRKGRSTQKNEAEAKPKQSGTGESQNPLCKPMIGVTK